MDDNKVQSNKFDLIAKKLFRKNNILATPQEISPFFCQSSTNNQAINTSQSAKNIAQEYGYEEEEIFKTLHSLSDNDKDDGTISFLDLEKQERYDTLAQDIFNSLSGFKTDKENFEETLDDKTISDDDWVNIIQTFDDEYFEATSYSFIQLLDLNYPNGERKTEIIRQVTQKLFEAYNNGNDSALDVICEELYNGINPSGRVEQFVKEVMLNSSDKTLAQIIKRYNEINDSDLYEDIEKHISGANQPVYLDSIQRAQNYTELDNDTESDIIVKLNIEDYEGEDRQKAELINYFIDELDNTKNIALAQSDNVGYITNTLYNLFGNVSNKEIQDAIYSQEQMIIELTEILNGKGDISFEEAYKKWTGVDFDMEKIKQYQAVSNDYISAYNIMENSEIFQNTVMQADNLEEVYQAYSIYYGEDKAQEKMLEYLKEGMMNKENGAFENFGYPIDISFNENGELVVTRALNYSTRKSENEELQYETITYNLSKTPNIIKEFPRYFDDEKYIDEANTICIENFGASFEDIQENYYETQQEAVGNANKFQELINKYCKGQNKIIQQSADVLRHTGFAFIITGGVLTFVCPPASVLVMKAGSFMSLAGIFGDNQLTAIDQLHSSNGLTAEERQIIAQTTAREAIYMAGASVVGNAVSPYVNDLLSSAFQRLFPGHSIAPLIPSVSQSASFVQDVPNSLVATSNALAPAIFDSLPQASYIPSSAMSLAIMPELNLSIPQNSSSLNPAIYLPEDINEANMLIQNAKSAIEQLRTNSNRRAKELSKNIQKAIDTGDVDKLKRINDAIQIMDDESPVAKSTKALSADYAGFLSSNDYTRNSLIDLCESLGLSVDSAKIIQNKDGIYFYETPIGTISARAKGTDSIYSKVRNKMIALKAGAPFSTDDIVPMINDAQGARIVLKSMQRADDTIIMEKSGIEPQDLELFKKFVNNEEVDLSESKLAEFTACEAKMFEALAEEQTSPLVDSLCDSIKKGDVRVLEIENYSSQDGIPYCTQRQIAKLQRAYEEWYDETVKNIDNQSQYQLTINPKTGEESLYDTQSKIYFDKKLQVKTVQVDSSADKANGYTAIQFSTVTKEGQFQEIQLRGEAVNEMAESEHIIYDAKTDKETVSGPEYKGVRDAIQKLKNTDKKYMEEYDQYYRDVFMTYRKQELGFPDAKMPDISQYPLLKELLTPDELPLLSAEGIIELHDIIKSIKGKK